jgi:hypothetical protein
MTDIKAADLPIGTIVVVDGQSFTRTSRLPRFPWESTFVAFSNARIDDEIEKGAEVIQPGTATDEPEDGSYVAVKVPGVQGNRSGVWLFVRDDNVAKDLDLPKSDIRHWFAVTATGVSTVRPSAWRELCLLGPVAYVGSFVDRSSKEER